MERIDYPFNPFMAQAQPNQSMPVSFNSLAFPPAQNMYNSFEVMNGYRGM